MKSKIITFFGYFFIFLLTFVFLGTIYFGWVGPSNSYESYNAFPGLTFDEPTGFYQSPGDDPYNFVTEKQGRIIVFSDDATSNEKHVLLDIRERVYVTIEDGFLGMAFHPDYENNGKIYTYHSEHHSVRYGLDCETCASSLLTEYQITQEYPFSIVPDSQRIILELNQTTPFHRAGQMIFDDQGKLFVFIGDGQQEDQVQNLNSLFGKIIRIDIDVQENGKEYGIPSDNPYVGQANVSEEIYAYGLRNPWRGSIDPVTKNMWVGDVGKDYYEEINLIEPTKNYGWPVYEGYGCKNNIPDCFLANTTFPVFAYPHPTSTIPLTSASDNPVGVAIIGGYVYRGENFKEEFYGDYVFADYAGSIFKMKIDENNQKEDIEFLHKLPDLVSQIGIDNDLELYFTGIYTGIIFNIRPADLLLFYNLLFLNLIFWYLFLRKRASIFFLNLDV